ncbi:Phosphoribosylformylglycinamidine synthase, PurS subunit [Pyrodictium delaneyi]|uniref:Phosphoribosylformylglycinamidine synthase subunit PurS n=1 Tax=Pyrodictium delaneyi TaxID=1273541 RepID=A0A0P0N4V4_9CREN|nr:phosphoribosylformylglycinamidine synthase subunit PurS [Pyrodictium delaneyi]ALL01478.1 Phosphoribosylformylglycinamidine synthase, PurS subunit [Pyrodictium delaneyi]
MPRHRVLVIVTYKPSARDPEGETLAAELRRLGYTWVQGIRAGKAFIVEVEAETREEAEKLVKEMAHETRLFNPAVHTLLVIPLA